MTKGRTDQEKGLAPPPETAAPAPGAAMSSSSSMRNLLGTNHPSLKPNLKSKNCPLSNKMHSVSISSSSSPSSVSAMMAEELNLIHNGDIEPGTRFRISKVQIRCRKCKARHAISKLNALQYQIRNGDATKIVALSNDKVVFNCTCGILRQVPMTM